MLVLLWAAMANRVRLVQHQQDKIKQSKSNKSLNHILLVSVIYLSKYFYPLRERNYLLYYNFTTLSRSKGKISYNYNIKKLINNFKHLLLKIYLFSGRGKSIIYLSVYCMIDCFVRLRQLADGGLAMTNGDDRLPRYARNDKTRLPRLYLQIKGLCF